jgi:peptidoglycan/xylan/chitin deacetylase (PgdA/CDA1 family)
LKPKIILTFDLEEFDLPLEYNCSVSDDLQFGISSEGLTELIALLKRYNVKATFFTTGNFCEKFPETIKALAENHEIASHAYSHSQFDEEFIIRSKKVLEAASGQQVKGFRMPRFQKVDYNNLLGAGYSYDSSVNPTYLPGRYNNFNVSRTPFKIPNAEIIEFPVSVSPLVRFPLSWYAFKNLPLFFFNRVCKSVLDHDQFLHLYFHPWEFANIDSFKIPAYIKKPSGEKYIKKFGNFLAWLSKNGEFVTITEFLESYKF